tara:strand:- start:222 stop:641 length:420 start_codon:yes stop_codon:yes gene_type:complete
MILKNVAIKSISLILAISILMPSFLVAQESQPQEKAKDYYYEGRIQAERDYKGGGAVAGGLASGLLLGFIGWGIGYLVVSNQNTEVPRRYIAELDTKDRLDYEDGYKDAVKKLRNSKFNSGGAIGALGALVINLAVMSE